MLTTEWVVEVVDLVGMCSILVAEFWLYLFMVVIALVSQECEWR
jgi:hypothetical protein